MLSTRLNLFTFPHKGLRNAIAQLSRLTGQVECTDTQQLEALNSLADEVFCCLIFMPIPKSPSFYEL